MSAAVFTASFAALYAGHSFGLTAEDLGLSPQSIERFATKVPATTPEACWTWLGNRLSWGYGRIGLEGRTFRAHILAYQLVRGSIPSGAHIDHRCHNIDANCGGGTSCPHRACCNPFHLEAVPPVVNILRGNGLGAINRRKTHCSAGHPFSEENTQLTGRGGRRCRSCAGLTGRGQAHNAQKTHCPAGHRYNAANTYVDRNGRRTCRACHRERVRLASIARKAAA